MNMRTMAIALGLATITAAALVAMPARARAQQSGGYTGRRIDLDFKEANIENIMKLLGQVGDVHIVLDPALKGTKVTIQMRNVPWDEAFDVVLRGKRLRAERDKDVIHVMPAK